jgi:acetylornithine deacetylase
MNETAQLLAELVKIPRVSGNEAAAADHVQAWLAARGVPSQRLGHTVVAEVVGELVVAGATARPTLLLNSHLDTVPAGEGWDTDPLLGEWKDGKLVGLGANDAGGCVAAMMQATVRMAAKRDFPGKLILSLHAEEETNNRGMGDFLAAYGAPDAAITGEPTGLEVVRSQAGLAILTLKWRGKSCHAAHVARVEHDNALLQATRELAQLPDWLHPGTEHPLLGKSTLAVTALHSGGPHNKVPDLAEALVDARLVPPTTAAECVALLQERLPRAEVAIRSERLGPIDTAEVDLLVCVALQAAGQTQAIGSTTLSDMALLPPGVPAVKVGPGQTARSHTPNEFLLESELDAGVAFYESCARAWLHAAAATPAESTLAN